MDWNSFWASFWSGLFYSLIAGYFVTWWIGRKLLHYEQASADLRFRRECELELEVAKDRLRMVLEGADKIFLDSISEPGPVTEFESFKLLSGCPLRTWRRVLVNDAAFFNAAINFHAAHLVFAAAAGRLETRLVNYIRRKNHAKGNIPALDRETIVYFVGRMFDMSEEEFAPFFQLQSVSGYLPYWSSIYDEFMADQAFRPLIEGYLSSRRERSEALSSLNQSLKATSV